MRFLCLFLLIVFSCNHQNENAKIVKTINAYNEAVAIAKPGDVIVLANGVWNNAELVFEGKGTKEQPIILTVEEKGKVILSGESNLQLAGEHLLVDGLVFKNGYSPTKAVISFRKNKNELANNCRLTECVIDNFNKPDRYTQDYWVAVYGKNNRIDHNHISGKKNLGVTVAVRLDSEASRENNHKLDHNYFGPRPTFGNNGGETLRIGTSHYSLENSKTLVESNYFDKCNGEHEIISNKSCQNTFKYNTFFECTGTLTMRHGNETLVDGNVFLGNGKPSTGGIRVINESQTVINNYHYGLTGYRFRGAFVMMNGVPNSPANRYVQVTNAVVKNNAFVNCDHIQLCAGSDSERSAVPINSSIANNIFYHNSKENLFTVYDDISGINFEKNIIGSAMKTDIYEGFENSDIQLVENKYGFLIPKSEKLKSEIAIHPEIATKANTGVSWYSKAESLVALSSGKVIQVRAELNSLFNAVNNSTPGDILELESGKEYLLTKAVKIKHPLTITSTGKEKPIILFERMKVFEIENGGSLSLKNLKFDGAVAPDYAGNAVISTSKMSMTENYKLFIDNCNFEDLDKNHSFDVLKISKGTFADTISISNSKFKNITGHIAALDKETDDIGAYSVEYLILKNNVFTDIQGTAIRLYRGGKDESTFGPFLEVNHNVFNNIGHGKKNKYKSAVSLYGVQVNEINNNIFSNSKAVNMHLVVGEPIVNVLHNNFYNSESINVTGDQKYTIDKLWQYNPDFIKEEFQLSDGSPLKNKGTDGLDLGIISKQ